MAASATPGSAERQARGGGAASATGNAVSRPVPSRACRVLGRVPARAAAGIWRAFGVPCLAMVGSLLFFWWWDFWVSLAGMTSRRCSGGRFMDGRVVGAACLRWGARARTLGGVSLLRLILPLLMLPGFWLDWTVMDLVSGVRLVFMRTSNSCRSWRY